VVLLNSQGLVEIARNMADAATSLGAAAGDSLAIYTSGMPSTN
jgi:hypothetical protein